jgi:hypothetical protein
VIRDDTGQSEDFSGLGYSENDNLAFGRSGGDLGFSGTQNEHALGILPFRE